MNKIIVWIIISLFIACGGFSAEIPIHKATDKQIIALTIYKEARGEGAKGMKSVASVIKNRSKKKNFRKVCLKPYQFSCFNGVKSVKLPKDKEYKYCLNLAESLLNGSFKVNHTFTHYYNSSLCSPSWGAKLRYSLIIGNHTFGKF